jgi:indolepyruvate ferredoxin oxidoreductase beta subunit
MKKQEKNRQINIYMAGVGGQGIGLLSEALIRAYDYAGLEVRGADTHGLSQRGGIVSSTLRAGPGVFSPLIEPGMADIVLALERTEAFRACRDMLKEGGTLIYYDAYWQPLPVRLKESGDIRTEDVSEYAASRNIRTERVFEENLPDPRMQNTALLSHALRHGLLPFVTVREMRQAYGDLLSEPLLGQNLDFLVI